MNAWREPPAWDQDTGELRSSLHPVRPVKPHPSSSLDPRAAVPRMRLLLPTCTAREAQVVSALLNQRSFDARTSLKSVAGEAGVSEALVVKIAKKLGFGGFRELRAALAEYNQLPVAEMHRELSPTDTTRDILEKVFRTSIKALEETLAILDEAALERAADLLYRARRRDFYGLGGSAQIARDVAHKFLRIGFLATVHDDAHMMLMSASLLGDEDVVVAFSHSGQTSTLLDAARLARRQRAKIVVVTNFAVSPLAELADVLLCSTAEGSPLTGENAAARIAQLNILDALFVMVAKLDLVAAEGNLEKTMSAVRSKRAVV